MPDPSLPLAVGALRDAVRDALDGGPAVVPLPRTTAAPVPAGTALVVRTSGSTGTPREVALPAAALRASAAATHARLGGPGRWVLTLPATHVAGLQVVVRSVLADTPLVAAEPGARFAPDGLADLLEPALDAGDAPLYVSLVPTQVHRLLEAARDGAPRGLAALARCGAVLLGGAASPPALLRRAAEAGVRVVTTYGMSETAGGCVYDGVPLSGVRVRLAPPGSSEPQGGLGHRGADEPGAVGVVGVVELGGPTLATGYLGGDDATAAAFRTDDDGARWFRTSDLGRLHPDGRLEVLGRADDVVVTGGVNVAPAPVEALVGELCGGEACVVGVPDPEWGQAVVAVVTGPASSALDVVDDTELARVRSVATTRLGAPSAPRRVYRTAALPLRGPGKVDRNGVVALVLAHEQHVHEARG
ncbi:AMP-binding protein [Isoptericola sp. 4D.3]|uniref:AMP-binding protein n=1 Tax=Isoptericola peretonis TaxID=2918523 RepID=A0ABT0IZX4_9MICO|nr:AMP-binding protein [Isoptericola sp. 4D.3]